MSIENEEVENSYLDNKELWSLWQRHGITEATPFIVDFQFITHQEGSARELFELYKEQDGKKVEVYVKDGTWNVEISMPSQTWTLEKLDQQAREFHEIAKKHGCSIDGIGAIIPD
jgi:hypothetical protein